MKFESIKIAKLTLLALGLFSTVGCAAKINSFTVGTVLDRATDRPDIDRVCSVGEALGIPLMSLTSKKHYPKKALIIAEVAAAMCAEMEAREHALDIALAKKNLPLGPGKIATIKDARVQEARARQLAALRYYAAFQYLEEQWGEAGEACPTLKERDEIAYFLGLYAGLSGTLHDSASGRHVGVPQGTLGKVARATRCIDNERWWNGPGAFQAAIWATLGGQPPGIEPWESPQLRPYPRRNPQPLRQAGAPRGRQGGGGSGSWLLGRCWHDFLEHLVVEFQHAVNSAHSARVARLGL